MGLNMYKRLLGKRADTNTMLKEGGSLYSEIFVISQYSLQYHSGIFL